MDKLPSEEVQRLLKEVVEHFEREDRAVRERQIRICKKLKYYWNGFQRLWWSEIAHDWRVFDETIRDSSEGIGDAAFYDKPVNIFRAYLESIIAALSVTIPSITCAPDDADNALDISTAKAGNKIATLVYKHNDVPALWLHALYILCTEGLVACYSYPKEDEAYGTYEEKEYEDEEQTQQNKYCPTCGTPLQDTTQAAEMSDMERDEFQPGDDDVAAHDLLNKNEFICPQCLITVDPEIREEKIIIPRFVGITKKPKTRICMEVYGQLFVKVANYARRQCETPYLIYSYETHYANAIDRYEHLKDKKTKESLINPSMSSLYDPYEKWGRVSTQYFGEMPINNVTVRNAWLRPEAFNILKFEDAEELKKKYPDGAKVVLVGDIVADVENESLDDSWTLTHNPLSDYIHFDPLGNLITSIQEVTNDIVSLAIQTIEHGIAQTFVDPNVVNFQQYREVESTPGMIFPAKPPSGKALGDGFFQTKTATLSGEVQPFMEKIQEAGQLVSGALPSLFGGAAPNSSKTAAQYAMSRAQALQRLQTPWKMLTIWWKNIFGKVIPMYMKEVKDDEKYVVKDPTGNFVNVFIRKAELDGKIGDVELEASDQLPLTWSQQKDVIMQLLQAGNPEIMAALSSPENITILAEAIGLDDFTIPGEDDRQKQYEEIKVLLASEPFKVPSMDPNTGQPIEDEQPSIEVEPLVDNHMIHLSVCRQFLVSDAGRLAKSENANGYRNVLLHMKQHMDMERAFNMEAPAPNQQPKPGGGQPSSNSAPAAQEVKNNGQPEPVSGQ